VSTPRHCPGFEANQNLQSFVCKCPNCGKEKEIFSDEFDREHKCSGCQQTIDFSACTMEGGA